MRLTGSGAYARPPPTPKMPPGLIELMEGLTKDVLKNNPDDIYKFCAEHMQKLLDIRDGAVPKKNMSLDEKIKRAQEKIKQKIKERESQYQKEMSDLSTNGSLEKEKSGTKLENRVIIDNPVESLSASKQPVHHGDNLVRANEVEIFHEPDVTITTSDIYENDMLKKENEIEEYPLGNTETIQNNNMLIKAVEEEIKESSVDSKANIPISPETLQNAELTYKVNKEAEECAVDIEVGIPATLEAVQSEISPNALKEKENMVEIVPVTSVKLQSEESTREAEEKEKEKTDGNDIEPASEVKQDIYEAESTNHVSDMNTDGISKKIQNEELLKNSEVTLKPSDSVIDNATAESKDGDKTVVIDFNEVITKREEEKDMIPVQQMKENLDFENVSQTQIDNVIEENEIDEERNGDVSKFIENNLVTVENENNSKNDEKTVLNESKENSEVNSKESLLQSSLGSSTSGENQSTETATSVQVIIENDLLPNAKPLENLEHSNDHVDENVHRNTVYDISQVHVDTVELKDEKNPISEELFLKENDIIHNNTSGSKNDIILESDEPAENTEGSGMDLETAAITIQKVFRTFLFSKSRASTLDDTVNENSLDEEIEKKNFQDEPEYVISSANLNKERRTLGISRMDTVLQTVNEEKSLSLSTDDSSTLSSAATTIQAHVRGFLVRNRLTSYKTTSNSSLVNSEGPSTTSLDGDTNEPKKTILNIHIVPERGQFMSRDESMLTSIDLPLDNSPPSSINLHPLGYDKSEPRKQLKREDAIQSISPPSNNSGKLSEEVDSVKDSLELKQDENSTNSLMSNDKRRDVDTESCDTTLTISSAADTVVDVETYNSRDVLSSPGRNSEADIKHEEPVTNLSSDETDVVTPFPIAIEKTLQEADNDEKPKLIHSGEFHDIVVQTQVKRSESSVVREFKNVLVFFLLWDKT